MILDSIAVYIVPLRPHAPSTFSQNNNQSIQRPFVVLQTENGVRGVGEIPIIDQSQFPLIVTTLREHLIPAIFQTQLDLGDIGDVTILRRSYAQVATDNAAKYGVEAAFWDTLAQITQKPLWRLWGGARRAFPVGVTIRGETVEQVLDQTEKAIEQGFRRVKVDIHPGFDIQPISAIRETFPDLLFQVNANATYDRSNWHVLKEIDNLDLLLIEQPMPPDNIRALGEFSEQIRTPIGLSASICSRRDAENAMTFWRHRNILNRLVISVTPPRISGFDEAIGIIRSCQRQGVRTWIGEMHESAWGKAFNLNLNGLDEVKLTGDYFSADGATFSDDITPQPIISQNGAYALSNGVSIGFPFDWNLFDRRAQRAFKYSATDFT